MVYAKLEHIHCSYGANMNQIENVRKGKFNWNKLWKITTLVRWSNILETKFSKKSEKIILSELRKGAQDFLYLQNKNSKKNNAI